MNIPLHQVPALSAALMTTEASGVIDRIAVEPRSPADLARLCAVNANACEHMLSVLEAFGLVTRDGNRYVAGEELRDRARRPTVMRLESALWQHAPIFLCSGEPLMAMDAEPAERELIYRDVVAELGTLFAPAADYLAEHAGLNPESILDVGCGSGVWSLAFARRWHGARVTGLDLPAVLDQFRARAAEMGVSGRVATIEGDMHASRFRRVGGIWWSSPTS